MDKLIRSIVAHSARYRSLNLSYAITHECKRHLIDLMACGLAAFNEPAVSMSRDFASRYPHDKPINFPNVLGSQMSVCAEMAAFTNAFAIRYFDGSDTYPGGGGHPSDCWAGLISLAQQEDASIQSLFQSVLVAYDVFYELFKASNLREKGIDNSFYVTVATAVGSAHLLDLSPERFANALSLAIVPNVSLGVARTGSLSMWKAGASANAARNGVFAALLAQEGMTGPELPFSGERGLFFISSDFDLIFPSTLDRPRIFEAHMKRYLCDYHSQTAIDAAIQLHSMVRVSEISKVMVSTYAFAHSEVANDPSKWRPKNRETADHSLPWIVAAVLMDGEFTEAIFTQERFRDAKLIELCDRVEVIEDQSLTKMFPAKVPCKIKIILKTGDELEASAELPQGHPDFPMDDTVLSQKFLALSQKLISLDKSKKCLESLWELDVKSSTRQLFINI